MMDGVVHSFYISSESDINQGIQDKIYYTNFRKNHEKTFIEDNFIQLLLINRYLIDVPSYNYNNTELTVGIDPLSGSILKNEQIPLFLKKLDIFESEIDDEKNKLGMQDFGCTKHEVLKEFYKLRDFLKKALESNMCVYHVGI